MTSSPQPEAILKSPERRRRWFDPPKLTWPRIVFAFVVAVATDAVQLGLGPVGWALIDDGLDVVAMVLTCWALGFHVLLLPTFVIKALPVADMIPLWTGCVGAVVALRRKKQGAESEVQRVETTERKEGDGTIKNR